jgi:hypothetical protein
MTGEAEFRVQNFAGIIRPISELQAHAAFIAV